MCSKPAFGNLAWAELHAGQTSVCILYFGVSLYLLELMKANMYIQYLQCRFLLADFHSLSLLRGMSNWKVVALA